MGNTNITSENQSGGITAQNVTNANQITGVRTTPKRAWSKKAWAVIVGLAAIVAAVVAVLTYFGFNHK